MATVLVKKIKIVQIVFLSFTFGLISCLVTVPVHDDLLGPGQCPTGSFCIDTAYCTNEYYTTKSGLPFYCGPNHQIDSMICCVSTSAAVVQPSRKLEQDLKNDADPFNLNELEQIIRTNRSASDDDEVDILSIPFPTNQIESNPFDDLTLPESNAELEGHFDTPRDLEAMLEDVIEQELSADQDQEQEQSTFAAKEEGMRDAFQNSAVMNDILEALETNKIRDEGASQDQTIQVPVLGRAAMDPFDRTPCPCEKGDPGPPGEPGKIIYIPVFISTNGYTAPPMNPTGIPSSGFAPVPFNPAYMSNQGQAIPLHPNPTVIPYGVPINIPPSNNPSPPPLQTAVPPLPHPPQPQFPQPTQPPQPQPIPSAPSSIPYADSLQARLARQAAAAAASGQRQESSRRYHGRAN